MRVLGSGTSDAAPQVVDHFLDYLRAQGLQVDWWQTVESRGAVAAAAVAILSPGRTAMFIVAPCRRGSADSMALVDILRAFCNRALSARLCLLQSLVSVPESGETDALAEAGFTHLAKLHYMVREVSACPPLECSPGLEPYSEARHELFVNTLADTYSGSLDCPALSGVRQMDDIIAGHRATGLHDPALWFLSRDDQGTTGVLLLTRVPLRSAIEVVYVGVVPRARGRGLGRQMVHAALRHAHAEGQHQLMLAVDAENHFASNIYSSLGFVRTESRYAWIRAVASL